MRALRLSAVLGVSLAAMLATASAGVVEDRVANFKSARDDLRGIFRTHLKEKDFAAIEAAAMRLAAWGERIPAHFPPDSTSDGARPEIWDNFEDFSARAARFKDAAEALAEIARTGGDTPSLRKAALRQAAQKVGGTCKACHDTYRIKK